MHRGNQKPHFLALQYLILTCTAEFLPLPRLQHYRASYRELQGPNGIRYPTPPASRLEAKVIPPDPTEVKAETIFFQRNLLGRLSALDHGAGAAVLEEPVTRCNAREWRTESSQEGSRHAGVGVCVPSDSPGRTLGDGFFLNKTKGSMMHEGRQTEPCSANKKRFPSAEARQARGGFQRTGQGRRGEIGSAGLDGVFVQLADGNKAGGRGPLPALPARVGKRRNGARRAVLSSARARTPPLRALTGKRSQAASISFNLFTGVLCPFQV